MILLKRCLLPPLKSPAIHIPYPGNKLLQKLSLRWNLKTHLQFFSGALWRQYSHLQCNLWGFPSGSVVKNPSAIQEIWVRSLGQEDPWRRKWQSTPVFLPRKNLINRRACGEGNGNPLQCSCLENPRDRAAWWAAVYGIAQKKKKEEPGGLQSMGSQKSRTQLSAKQQQYGLWVLGLWCLKVLGNSAPPRRL